MMLINHRRAEREATDATEGHQEPFHSTVGLSEVVRVARGAMVEAADEAEGGARR